MCGCFGREKLREISGTLPDEETKGSSDWGYAIAKNDRRQMKDAVSVVEDAAGYHLFAVYDHACKDAILAAKELLLEKMASYAERIRRRRSPLLEE